MNDDQRTDNNLTYLDKLDLKTHTAPFVRLKAPNGEIVEIKALFTDVWQGLIRAGFVLVNEIDGEDS